MSLKTDTQFDLGYTTKKYIQLEALLHTIFSPIGYIYQGCHTKGPPTPIQRETENTTAGDMSNPKKKHPWLYVGNSYCINI